MQEQKPDTPVGKGGAETHVLENGPVTAEIPALSLPEEPADATNDAALLGPSLDGVQPAGSHLEEPEAATSHEIDIAPMQTADFFSEEQPAEASVSSEAGMLAILEAIVYVTDEPLSFQQIASALGKPAPEVQVLLDRLVAEFEKPHHGLSIKEVAGGYKMATKPEHHEAVRSFVKNLNPPMKLSMAALETLAVIAYKQPLTAPEIMEIRGVQGAGVLKTLLDRKLITTAGRKNVVGKPILYKTTKEFLVQFGLKDLNELPSLKEFEEIRRFAFEDTPEPPAEDPPSQEPPAGDPPPAELPHGEPGPEPEPVKADE